MKKLRTLIAATALVFAGGASAAPVIGSGLQGVLNGLYTCASCDGTAPDANTQQANEVGTFVISAGMGSITTMIIELAGNAGSNRLGIYDPFSTARLQLFGGSASTAAQSLLMVGMGAGSSVNFTSVNLTGWATFRDSSGKVTSNNTYVNTSVSLWVRPNQYVFQTVNPNLYVTFYRDGKIVGSTYMNGSISVNGWPSSNFFSLSGSGYLNGSIYVEDAQ